jgi:hypothetical protein
MSKQLGDSIRICFDYLKINALTGPREKLTRGREGQAKFCWAAKNMVTCLEYGRGGGVVGSDKQRLGRETVVSSPSRSRRISTTQWHGGAATGGRESEAEPRRNEAWSRCRLLPQSWWLTSSLEFAHAFHFPLTPLLPQFRYSWHSVRGSRLVEVAEEKATSGAAPRHRGGGEGWAWLHTRWTMKRQ